MSDETHELRLELLALRCVCGVLLAEIAHLSPNPGQTLLRITSGLQGVVDGVSRGLAPDEQADAAVLTRVVEKIVSIAEIAAPASR